jgi:hypothetical protein
VPNGFIAELTYGEHVNWYRNVVVTGRCVVLHQGKEYEIVAIEPCEPDSGRAAYPQPVRTILRITHRKDFRLLRSEGAGRLSR